MADEVLLDVDGDGVAVITFNRPDRHNAFTDASDRQLFAILRDLHGREDVRCVVLRGEGRSFSSGRDTSELGIRPSGESDHDYIAAGHAGTKVLLDLPVPTIAALKGWVIGGSFERALLCDLRIAADDARMTLPELTHGVLCDSAGVARLFQMAGHGLAADLALTGRLMDAEEALRHGVVSRVVAADRLEDEVMEVARAIASRPPLAMRLAKEAISRLGTPQVLDQLDHERLAQTTVMASPDFVAAREARAASRAGA